MDKLYRPDGIVNLDDPPYFHGIFASKSVQSFPNRPLEPDAG